ncbi:MAG: glycoside hydrolase family 18 protein [Bacillales bacterium]|nr:glycoside hydrolase family 18 protein [Bacillales bacterium]
MNKIVLATIILCLAITQFHTQAFAQSTSSSFIIHEVKAGESLWKIANKYNQTVSSIQKRNGLSTDQIVPGQSLLIPGTTYTISRGESLWTIANRHSLSVRQLARFNGMKDPSVVRAGAKIYIPQYKKHRIMTGAYMVPKNKESDQSLLRNYRPLVSQIGVFEYHPDWNGNLSSLQAITAITEGWKQHMVPVAVITNLSAKGFDHQLAHHILNNPSLRKKLINNIERLLRYNDFKGVNIDFEGVRSEDRTALNLFMKELANKLQPSGFTVSIAVPPKQGDRYPSHFAGYDYAALGKVVDYMFLMTYDWHWFGGPPGPIAPINQVRATLNYAVNTVPKQKLFLGIAMYAYDWIYLRNGATKGISRSQNEAVKLAMDHGAPIMYDLSSKSPYFFYTDKKGNKHVVWFEDARSMIAKYRLISQYGIRGMGGWKLGLPFPQAEAMLRQMFWIEKP